MEVIQSAVFKARAALADASSTVAGLKARRSVLVGTAAAAAEVRSREREIVIGALIDQRDTPLPEQVVGEAEFAAALAFLDQKLKIAVEAEEICRSRLRGAIADHAIAKRAAAAAVVEEAQDAYASAIVELWALDLVTLKVTTYRAIAGGSLTHVEIRDCTRGGALAHNVHSMRRRAEERADQLRAEIAAECGEPFLPF